VEGDNACVMFNIMIESMVTEFLMDPDGRERFVRSLDMIKPEMTAITMSPYLPIKRMFPKSIKCSSRVGF
jgi:hypothetical protein